MTTRYILVMLQRTFHLQKREVNVFIELLLGHSYPTMFGLFKSVSGCMSDSPKIMYFWRIRQGCGIVKSLRNLVPTMILW